MDSHGWLGRVTEWPPHWYMRSIILFTINDSSGIVRPNLHIIPECLHGYANHLINQKNLIDLQYKVVWEFGKLSAIALYLTQKSEFGFTFLFIEDVETIIFPIRKVIRFFFFQKINIVIIISCYFIPFFGKAFI